MENQTQTTTDSSPWCEQELAKSKYANLDPGLMTYYYGTYSLLTVINIVGNSIVLTTICRHRSLWTPCNSFYVSLAVSDLMLAVVYPTYVVSHTAVPPITDVLGPWPVCRVIVTELFSLEMCCGYALVAITVSRQIVIAHPLRYHRYLTPRTCGAVILTIWVVSHTFCIVLYALHETGKDYCNICRYELMFSVEQLTSLTVVQFFLPFSLMLTLYIRMALVARKLNRRIMVGPSVFDHRINRARSQQRSAVLISLLVGCFTVAWTPMLVYFFLIIAGGMKEVDYQYFSATTRICLYFNSTVNVFIYAGRMPEFRSHVRRDLGRVLPCVTKPRESSLGRGSST